jgi:4-amino-4-deoxy-L-arabinose transferase-like glycosyltransferase
MSSSPSRSEPGAWREAFVVSAMTMAGGMLRIWSIGRLGLVHFDEGIYAMAGTWAVTPRGLGGLDPTVISYAPPGFPILVGLAYSLVGVSDLSAILVSIVAGTVTIPVAGWLGYRTFGRGAGAAASAFAAMSGPHIAFSRMALTDAPFLLFWLLAIGQGQRFVERPGFARAMALGLAVGCAQLFKYNGWLAGVVVALGAAAWVAIRPDDRARGKQLALWGWGALAALVAAIVYTPWFRFVEAHGGYAALLAHHRGYMGGLASWPGHALLQLEQDRALSGGVVWMTMGGLAAAAGTLLAAEGAGGPRPCRATALLIMASLAALCAFVHGALFGAVLWIVVFALTRFEAMNRPSIVLAVGWGVLAVLTPFYHPYARLMLPIQGVAWILMGGAFAILRRGLDRSAESDPRRVLGLPRSLLAFAAACWIVPLAIAVTNGARVAPRSISELLEPSDSLRRACHSVVLAFRSNSGLRIYARPPLTFYLATGIRVDPQPSLERLFTPGPRESLTAFDRALLDSAMVRQEGGIRGRLGAAGGRWELEREFPTTMNLPTWLDVDPLAADGRSADRSAPLLLFRPMAQGESR